MNFSVHLPDPLLRQLDQFANANAKSRSSIVREAVSEYITARTANTWPDELAAWMKSATKKAPDIRSDTTDQDWPDFDAIRHESNASAAKRLSSF
jgi:predicted transcriptional regulator